MKFNSDNIITEFIKELLESTYIPTIPIWNEHKNMYKNNYYVYNTSIIKAESDWNPDLEETPSYKKISSYNRNKFAPGINSNFVSTISGYDSETHKALGDYLRMLRDLDGLDLMQYYNCFNSTYTDKIRITTEKTDTGYTKTIKKYDNSVNDGCTVTLIPIKYDQDYTIYINNIGSIDICTCLYDGINIIDSLGGDISDEEDFYSLYKTINYCSFEQPYYFKGHSLTGRSYTISDLDTSANELKWEKYLYLAIQTPETLNSNIVVLEGDFRSSKFINIGALDNNIVQVVGGNNYISVPSLTRKFTNKNITPFSDRLIEYLLLNVINKNEKITHNIERIQKYLSTNKAAGLFGSKFKIQGNYNDIWTSDLRNHIYKTVTQNYKSPVRIDVNGYVDKDTENIILGGKE